MFLQRIEYHGLCELLRSYPYAFCAYFKNSYIVRVCMQLFVDSLAFSLGLATTLAVLGIGASLAGKAYGQIGQGIPIAVSVVAMIMGLNLLEVRSN